MRKPKWGIVFFSTNRKDICFNGFQVIRFFNSFIMPKDNAFNYQIPILEEEGYSSCSSKIRINTANNGEIIENISRRDT